MKVLFFNLMRITLGMSRFCPITGNYFLKLTILNVHFYPQNPPHIYERVLIHKSGKIIKALKKVADT